MVAPVCVARIGAPHGVRGAVKLWTFTEDPLAVKRYGPLATRDGARHFEVVKSTVRGRTTTGVRPLAGKEREEEISRLLAGARVTETTRKQARELLHAVESAGAGSAAPGRAASRRSASGPA